MRRTSTDGRRTRTAPPAAAAKLTPRQENAISILLRVPEHDLAAGLIGCGVSTLRRWLAEPAFQEAYRLARWQVVEQGIAQMQAVFGEAVETLHRNMTAPRPGDQIKAANGLMDRMMRGTEIVELAQRLAALERRLASGQGGSDDIAD